MTPDLSGKSRETTAKALTSITMALVGDRPRKPDDDLLWKVLYTDAFAPAVRPKDERSKRVVAPNGPMELSAEQRIAQDWLRKASIRSRT